MPARALVDQRQGCEVSGFHWLRPVMSPIEPHDHMVQQLFAIGLGLGGVVDALECPGDRTHLRECLDTLDALIHRLQESAFTDVGSSASAREWAS